MIIQLSYKRPGHIFYPFRTCPSLFSRVWQLHMCMFFRLINGNQLGFSKPAGTIIDLDQRFLKFVVGLKVLPKLSYILVMGMIDVIKNDNPSNWDVS